jgi:hypothetical protein
MKFNLVTREPSRVKQAEFTEYSFYSVKDRALTHFMSMCTIVHDYYCLWTTLYLMVSCHY